MVVWARGEGRRDGQEDTVQPAGHTFAGEFHKFSCMCARISFLLNSQLVATQLQTETDFHLITPNDIILGSAARPRG